MKQFLLLVWILSLSAGKIYAQQPCCPLEVFIRDSINCAYTPLVSDPLAHKYGNSDSTAIRACQFSKMKYNIILSWPSNCTFPNFQIDTIIAVGGTVVSYNNSSFTIQWGGSNTGNVQIQFSIPGGSAGGQGCSGTINLFFKLLPNPIAAFTASPNPACFNNPTNITFNSSASVGALSYLWDFGDGFTSTQANPVHAYTSPGTYVVCLTVTNTPPGQGGTAPTSDCPSCSDSVCQTVVINNLPGPDITCIATVCAGETGTYCTSATCSTYNWVVTGGVITSGNNTPCITVQWGSGNPQGNIHLDVPGCPGFCSQGTDITVPIIPVSTTITGPSLVCLGTTSGYSLPAFPGTTYAWSISGGQLINGNNTNTTSITTTWNNLGTYTVTCVYFDTALNCGGTGTIVVNVLAELKITGPKLRCAGQNSTLISSNSFTNANVNCTWTVTPTGATITGGNGTASANFNWPNAGTFVVTATPVNPNQVCGPTSITVVVFPAPVISAINGPDSICGGGISVYSATSNAAGIFNWTIVGGTPTNLGPNNDSVQINWNPAGPYSITVTQTSYANNCPSLPFSKTVFKYPNPALTGPTIVCADNIGTYTITNQGGSNFNWSISPAQFGTITSAPGANPVTIKWHGNNNPGVSNTVYLHYGICNNDSIAITINEPIAPVINATGSLCPNGVNLSVSVTGIFSWSCIEHPITPTQAQNTSSLTALNQPGHYTVQIQNYNNTGCTVSATYNIPNVGMPVAQISAAGPVVYCAPATLNLNLTAVTGGGYTYQWHLNSSPIPGATNSVYNLNPGNTPSGAATYLYHCVVSLGGCSAVSNTITIHVINCPAGGNGGGVGCPGSMVITNITGCNPFTISTAVTNGVYIIPGTTSITHFEDNLVLSGNTTRSYTSIGIKSIRVCVSIKMADSSTCIVCKDTFVTVTVAADFIRNVNCNVVALTDQSTVQSGFNITNYNWSVAPSGTFNNNTMPSPTLTVSSSGTYTITLTVTASNGCTSTRVQQVTINLPDADFNVNPISCVGTAVNLNNLFPAPINYWNFGDATSSSTSPTFHAYASTGPFNITHIVTDAFGCKDTVIKSINIIAAPVCNINVTGPTTFCSGDSVKLSACTGLSAYQWKNNGVAIAGATNQIYHATQTGNYSFTAVNPFGCDVTSDTVSVTVLQSPSTSMTFNGKKCFGETYSVTVPSCAGCFYVWEVNGNVEQTGPSNTLSAIVGSTPFTLGTHLIKVTIFGSNGCMSMDSVVVTFNPQPTVSINVVGNPSQLCSNNTYTFNAVSNASSPSWAWTLGNFNSILSTTYSLTASSSGLYTVLVTDGITGCTNTASQMIDPSPDLSLFPIGCDTLCQNTSIFLPLASFNGNISGYTITWYDNAPPYIGPNIVGTGISLNLNSLALGPHNLSVIVVGPNGCVDTSNVYYIFIVPSTSSSTSASACGSYTWSVNGVTYTASGTYTNTSINNNGCPHYDTLQLVISTGTTTTQSATACDFYTWTVNGVTYTASGTYTHTVALANGCIQTTVLNLIIYRSTESSNNMTACGSYNWPLNGVTYTASGTYSFTSLNSFGCPHLNILNLVITNGTSSSTTVNACNPYTWNVNGVTYTASGTYIHTTAVAGGCIHTDTLILTIGAATGSSSTVAACNFYTWSVNGVTYTVSGTYTHTTIDPTGCNHYDTLILTIHHDIDTITNATACGSYTWQANGVTYTASGTYSFTTSLPGGCIKYNILNLNISNAGSTTVSSATACNPYTWSVNGVTYTASGTYTYTALNAEGCVNTWTLHLTLGENSQSTLNATACDVYTWSQNGVTYTTSGTYTHTVNTANGCVHTYTLVLTIYPTSTVTINATACGSYTWTLNGVTYTASGIYSFTALSEHGCPVVYALCLIILQNTGSQVNASACGSYTWPLNGVTYTSSGTYTHTTLNANGCVHTTTLVLNLLSPTSSSTSFTACGSYTWPLNGVTYTSSGTYTHTAMNTEGCPHTYILHLTINAGTNTIINVVACDAYTWFGTTYTSSGTYTHTTMSAGGCIQTTTLNLTINYSSVITTFVTVCGSYTWTLNGVTYTASGNYMVMTIGPNGCPRLYVLCLIVNQPSSSTINATACGSYTWAANGVTYTASGTYTYTTLNANGCLHTATLNLSIFQSSSSMTTATACNSYVWMANGVTYTASGTYTFTTLNTAGCPHTATLFLTIYPAINSTVSITRCDEYTWPVNGVTYTNSGTYTHTSMSSNGCLNTWTLILSIHHSTSSFTNVTACNSYVWQANGQTYTASGSYSYTYLNLEGCPHTATLNLTLGNGSNTIVNVYACEMYTWALNGVTYTAAGTYTHTSLNSTGCIDTSTLVLSLGTTITTHIFDTACCSYTWQLNGVTYTTSGIYYYITLGPDGCPHFYILCIIVHPCNPVTTPIVSCGPYTWPVNGITYTASGTYTQTVLNANGCPILYTLNLTVGQGGGTTHIFDTACVSYYWPLNGVTYTASGIYSHIVYDQYGCPHVYILCVIIKPASHTTIQHTANISYTWPVNGVTYTSSGVYTATLTNAMGCDSVLTLNLTVIQPPTEIKMAAKAMLHGPYNTSTGLMTDSLRHMNLLPTNEPYSGPPFFKPQLLGGGGESASASTFAVTGNNAIVDWIHIEIRSATNSNILVATRNALIQRDGDIVSASDGVSPVNFLTLPSGNYYVSLKHRNHLGVMTASPVYLAGGAPVAVDFTTLPLHTVSTILSNGPCANHAGVQILWCGDPNFNKNIKYNGSLNDKDVILIAVGMGTPNNTVYGYRQEDVNMDGKVRYNNTDNDRSIILGIVGVSTPNKVLYQHTPN